MRRFLPVLALAALLAGCGDDPAAVTPTTAAATAAPPADGPDTRLTSARASCAYSASRGRVTYFAQASHHVPAPSSIRVVVGLYQGAVRVDVAVVDLLAVPPNTLARGTTVSYDLGGFDPAAPYECRADGAGILGE